MTPTSKVNGAIPTSISSAEGTTNAPHKASSGDFGAELRKFAAFRYGYRVRIRLGVRVTFRVRVRVPVRL